LHRQYQVFLKLNSFSLSFMLFKLKQRILDIP
jgi:hypothetical protein